MRNKAGNKSALAQLVASHKEPLIDGQGSKLVKFLLLGVRLIVAEAIGRQLLVARLAEPTGKRRPLFGRGVVVRRDLILVSHSSLSG